MWANNLAEQGHYAAAVDAAWPIEHARRLCGGWIDLGIEAGTAARGTLLARKLQLDPGCLSEVVAALQPEIRRPDREARAIRDAFASAICASAPANRPAVTPIPLLALLRDVRRALLAEAATGSADQRLFNSLGRMLGDAVFNADLPHWPAGASPDGHPVSLSLAGRYYRFAPVFDAARLPRRRWLLARGERGVQIVSDDGRLHASFELPADQLVLSPSGHRAISIMHRAGVLQLGRIDCVRRRAESWCDVPSAVVAPSFDGDVWAVWTEQGLCVIDALDDRWSALWRDRDARRPLQISSAPGQLATLSDDLELSVYSRVNAGLTLRQREQPSLPLPAGAQAPISAGIAPSGMLALSYPHNGGVALLCHGGPTRQTFHLGRLEIPCLSTRLIVGDMALGLVTVGEDITMAHLLGLDGSELARASLPRDDTPLLHPGASWVLGSRGAELAAFDPESGSLQARFAP